LALRTLFERDLVQRITTVEPVENIGHVVARIHRDRSDALAAPAFAAVKLVRAERAPLVVVHHAIRMAQLAAKVARFIDRLGGDDAHVAESVGNVVIDVLARALDHGGHARAGVEQVHAEAIEGVATDDTAGGRLAYVRSLHQHLAIDAVHPVDDVAIVQAHCFLLDGVLLAEGHLVFAIDVHGHGAPEVVQHTPDTLDAPQRADDAVRSGPVAIADVNRLAISHRGLRDGAGRQVDDYG